MISTYNSPIGKMLLDADCTGLTRLGFDKNKRFDGKVCYEYEEAALSVLEQTKQWLDIYFSGREPGFMPPIHMIGSDFRIMVWKILLQIPYGKTVTYGEIAQQIALQRGIEKMSAQAVGGAVGHNRIGIIIPCHRVVGTGGNLTGYAGGLDKKVKLLELENIDTSKMFMPKGAVL